MVDSDNSPPRIGLAIGALIVGGVVGYFIGKGGTAPQVPPTPTPAKPTPTAATSATAVPFSPLTCLTPGPQTIMVGDDGVPECPSAFIHTSQTVAWKATPGRTLWIRFPDATSFPNIACVANQCASDLPGTGTGSTNGTGYGYNINVFQTTTPTPRPGTRTPTPQTDHSRNRIIIIRP
jgi:hypothetical protein